MSSVYSRRAADNTPECSTYSGAFALAGLRPASASTSAPTTPRGSGSSPASWGPPLPASVRASITAGQLHASETVLPGLDEALYQEAQARRQRQQQREEEAASAAQELSRPRVSRNSKAICNGRLERELREAFHRCQLVPTPCRGGSASASSLEFRCPRERLPDIFRALGLLCDSDTGEPFCAKLGMLLDKEDTGLVLFGRLLAFLSKALDRDGQERPWQVPPGASLEEECFCHLEERLARAFGKLIPNRLSRPRTPSRPVSTSRLTQRGDGSLDHSLRGPSRDKSPRGRDMSPRGVGSNEDRSPRIGSSQRLCRAASNEGVPRSGFSGRSSTPTRQRAHSARSMRLEGDESTGRVADRCHLLYHQAVFASRESARLEEEIKALRMQEEMRECKFHPSVLPQKSRGSRNASPAPQPRNFEAAVSRMRAANQRHAEQRVDQDDRLPAGFRGEKYERLRRLGTQPFSCYYKTRGQSTRQPHLMYIDVNIGRGKTGRIGVHEGDDLRVLSKNFAKTYQLDRETTQRLEEMLHQAYEKRIAQQREGSPGYDEDGGVDENAYRQN